MHNNYELNDKIILKYFQLILKTLKWKKSIVLFAINTEILKVLKYQTFSKKTLVLSIISSKCGSKDEKIFKEEKSTEILIILGFITKLPKR